MLFGRVETPKGIGTSAKATFHAHILVWKSRNPKGDWNFYSGLNTYSNQ